MGLNYVRRPRREELDPPNDFVTVSLGHYDIRFSDHGEELITDFENKILDRVEETYRNLDFSDV